MESSPVQRSRVGLKWKLWGLALVPVGALFVLGIWSSRSLSQLETALSRANEARLPMANASSQMLVGTLAMHRSAGVPGTRFGVSSKRWKRHVQK